MSEKHWALDPKKNKAEIVAGPEPEDNTPKRVSKYKMIPVDEDTYNMVVALCEAYEMPKKSQGAMVRKLAKAETEKLAAVKLLPSTKGKGSKGGKDLPKAE